MSRFIQFNDEQVDTLTLLLYERLGRALADATYLELTERKLFEFRPREGIISMSVFWRHRTKEIMHKGRLTDIYLLTAGFWKHFNVKVWTDYSVKYSTHTLGKLAAELLLLLEELRLMDIIEKERPGTGSAFKTRREAYIAFHQNDVQTNMQKNLVADGLLNEVFIMLHGGMLLESDIEWGSLNLGLIKTIVEKVYDSVSTEDNVMIAERVIAIVEQFIEKDLAHQYYAIGDSISEKNMALNDHLGMGELDKGEEDVKETIEEVFRSWHAETESEAGIHLQYELEHGRSGKTDGNDATPGNEDAEIEQTGYGSSVSDNNNEDAEDEDSEKVEERDQKKQAGKMFGQEHINVVYEERRIEVIEEQENRRKLIVWREEQKPYVRSIVEEMKKRIDLKQDARREGLLLGRLSSKLTTLVLDERPKPFYRKNAPSVNLDAVFGLLVDGSASMIDKLDETKKAVLLFHDVLNKLKINHEIASYYEDAYKASAEVQPNYFERMHTFEDRNKDNALSVLSFEANEDNRDGFAIRWMAEQLSSRQEKHKFLLVFSDGEPSAFGYDRNGVLDTAEAVMETEKKGISVIHLFLSSEQPSEEQRELFAMMFGNKTVSSNSVDNFTEQTLRILRKLLTIVIRSN